jgi:signal transduction histidine kinase
MKRSEKILNALGQAYFTLSSNNSLESSITNVLGILGKATDVDRVYIFQNFQNSDNEEIFSQRYEWTKENITIQIDNPELQDIPWSIFMDLRLVMLERKTYSAIVKDIKNDSFRETLQSQEIKAVLFVPIYSNDLFWGWVGFDNCQTDETFTESQQDALLALASTIGNVIAMQKQQAEIQLANDRLKTALNSEKEVNKLKSRFVTTASHEFRTPLSTISGSTELMEMYISEISNLKLAEKYEKHINRIKKEINRMVILLNDTLILEKQSLGKYSYNPSQFSLSLYISNFVNEYYSQKIDNNRIKLIMPDLPMEIRSDSQILTHIVSNLLDNALKYSEENSTVKLIVEPFTTGVKISIVDQGIGIPEDEQVHLFESFFRASNVVGIVGTGLGLTIVKQFVELLNGTIAYTSALNKGSEFTITLPLQR